MIKRKFGMRYLNISQGRYNSFSHKNLNAYDLAGEDSGIDRFVTFNELEVIGILPYKTTGFANTVLFYDKDNDVTANAQIIEYNQDSEIAILQIQINLMQKENVCSGSYAVYYKDTQLLEISGNAQVKKKEDVFRAQYITLDMNTQDITLGGNVKGKVTDTKEPESAENSPEANIPEGLPPEAEAAETAVMQENEENDDGE